jgi:hypothetical protein
MVYFKTKNSNLGIFWRALEWKMLVYFKAIWYNLWSFGMIYGPFSIIGGSDKEKSGNPTLELVVCCRFH